MYLYQQPPRGLVTATLLFFTFSLFSQQFYLDYAKILDPGVNEQNSVKMAVSSDDYIYIAEEGANIYGDVDPGDDYVEISDQLQQGQFIYLIQLDDRARYLKHIILDSPGNDISRVIKLDEDNNVYILGEFRETIDLDPSEEIYEVSVPGDGFFLAKYDSDYNFISGVGIDTDNFYILDFEVDQEDNIILTGTFNNTIDLDFGSGEKTFTAFAGNGIFGNDIFIAKYTPTFQLIEAQTFGVPGNDYINDVFIGEDKKAYLQLGGKGVDSIDQSLVKIINGQSGPSSTTSHYIVRLSESMAIEKVFSFPTEDTRFQTGSADAKGNIYIGGRMKATSSTRSLEVIKLDKDGNIIWQHSSEPASNNLGYNVRDIRLHTDSTLFISVSPAAVWYINGDRNNTFTRNYPSQLSHLNYAVVMTTDGEDLSGTSYPGKRIVGTLEDYSFYAFGEVAGRTVMEETNGIPYILDDNIGTIKSKVYLSKITTTCQALDLEPTVPLVDECGGPGGIYFRSDSMQVDGNGTGLRYQWFAEGGRELANTTNTSALYRISGVFTNRLMIHQNFESGGGSSGYYYAQVADGCGNVIETDSIERRIWGPASARQNFLKQKYTFGETITIDAYTLDYPEYALRAQWYKGAFALYEDDKYQGTQTLSLTINDLDHWDDATYSCLIFVKFCDPIDQSASSTNIAITVEDVKRTTTNVTDLRDLNTKLFPNPAQDFVYLSQHSGQTVQGDLQIVDMNGKTVKAFNDIALFPDEQLMINVNDLSIGIYYLSYRGEGFSEMKKISVIR